MLRLLMSTLCRAEFPILHTRGSPWPCSFSTLPQYVCCLKSAFEKVRVKHPCRSGQASRTDHFPSDQETRLSCTLPWCNQLPPNITLLGGGKPNAPTTPPIRTRTRTWSVRTWDLKTDRSGLLVILGVGLFRVQGLQVLRVHSMGLFRV